jgi:hypothetical protein
MAQLDIQLPPIFQHPHIRHTQKKHTHYRGLPTSMALSSIKSLLKGRNPSRPSSNISQATTTTLHPDSSEPTFPQTNPIQSQPPSWSRSNPKQLPSPAERAASIWAADTAIRSHIRARWPDHHQDLIRIDCFSFRQGGGAVTTGSDNDDEENDDDDDEPGLTMSRLRRLGTLPRDEGIQACMRVVRAPVIQEEVARRLWEWIVEGGLEDEVDKEGEGEKLVVRTAGGEMVVGERGGDDDDLEGARGEVGGKRKKGKGGRGLAMKLFGISFLGCSQSWSVRRSFRRQGGGRRPRISAPYITNITPACPFCPGNCRALATLHQPADIPRTQPQQQVSHDEEQRSQEGFRSTQTSQPSLYLKDGEKWPLDFGHGRDDEESNLPNPIQRNDSSATNNTSNTRRLSGFSSSSTIVASSSSSSSSRSSRRSNGVDEESDVDDQLSVVTSVASTNADLKKVLARAGEEKHSIRNLVGMEMKRSGWVGRKGRRSWSFKDGESGRKAAAC